MSRKLSIIVLLCVAMLLPSIATAQFFAKQKVVVWAVMDRNNDVKVADATKTQIRTSIVDAFVNSRNYEAFEANINDVKARVGSAMSPINIAKAVKEMYGVDYVLFTSIKIMQHSSSYDNFQVHLSSDLFSAETQKSERMAYVDMKSDTREIPGACAKLLSDLLGEQLSVVSPQPQQQAYQQSNQQSLNPPSYIRKRNSVETILGYLKVFPNELGTFTNEPTSIIQQINNQHMHDYNTWRIPTAEELALLRANGYLGDAVYMSDQTVSSKGIVLLVTDDNETYSQKEAKSQEEEKTKARAREIALSGKGDNGVYKIGYYYDDGIKKGVVFEVSNGGKNGMIISANRAPGQKNWSDAKSWCSSLGGGWRLPTKEELLVICRNKDALIAVLAAVGDEIPTSWHWSSTESEFCAWSVAMYNGLTINYNKYNNFYVRAVSAF